MLFKLMQYKKTLASLIGITLGVVLFAQTRGTPSQIRVNIDSTGALAVAAAAIVPPTTSVVFANARLLVDASGNLVVTDGGGSGFAPSDATYLTKTLNAGLSNENVVAPTNDATIIGNGTDWITTVIPTCSTGSSALTYNITANAFGCNTITSTPAGSNTQIQFNNSGAFGASDNLTWDGTTFKIGNTDTVIELYDVTPIIQSLYGYTGDSIQSILNTELHVTPTDDSTRYFGSQMGIVLQGTHDVTRLWGQYSPTYHEANGDVTDSLGMVGHYVDTALTGVGGTITNLRGIVSQLTMNTGYTVTRAAFFDSGDNYSTAATIGALYGTYQGAITPSGGGSITTQTQFYGVALGGTATNSYSFWSDEQGVYRVRSDNTFNSVYQAIPALYNPQFTKYTPGLANYERCIPGCQWNSNVAEYGTEFGGAGTVLRAVKLIGSAVSTTATFSSGDFISTTTTPSVANIGANSCGTSAATIVGTDNAFAITVGATSGTACQVTFDTTAPNTWQCSYSNRTTANLARETAATSTTSDVTGIFVAGDVLIGNCWAR